MKKILSVLALSAVMATGVFAGEVTGNIDKVALQSSGDIIIRIIGTPQKTLLSSNSNKKELYAMALTAYASHSNVKMSFADGKIEALAIVPAP